MNVFTDINEDSCESTDSVLTPRSRKRKRNTDGPKSYKCEYCTKTFRSGISFQKHVLVHTSGDKFFDCDQCNRVGFTEKGLRLHKNHHHAKPIVQKTINNNELPTIDNFQIFEKSEEPTYASFDFVKAEIPRSPYSDECSNFSIDSTLSTLSSYSNFSETIGLPAFEPPSNAIPCTASDVGSLPSDIGTVSDLQEEAHDVDDDILLILRSQLEKNFIDVVLSFSDY